LEEGAYVSFFGKLEKKFMELINAEEIKLDELSLESSRDCN